MGKGGIIKFLPGCPHGKNGGRRTCINITIPCKGLEKRHFLM